VESSGLGKDQKFAVVSGLLLLAWMRLLVARVRIFVLLRSRMGGRARARFRRRFSCGFRTLL